MNQSGIFWAIFKFYKIICCSFLAKDLNLWSTLFILGVGKSFYTSEALKKVHIFYRFCKQNTENT